MVPGLLPQLSYPFINSHVFTMFCLMNFIFSIHDPRHVNWPNLDSLFLTGIPILPIILMFRYVRGDIYIYICHICIIFINRYITYIHTYIYYIYIYIYLCMHVTYIYIYIYIYICIYIYVYVYIYKWKYLIILNLIYDFNFLLIPCLTKFSPSNWKYFFPIFMQHNCQRLKISIKYKKMIFQRSPQILNELFQKILKVKNSFKISWLC